MEQQTPQKLQRNKLEVVLHKNFLFPFYSCEGYRSAITSLFEELGGRRL
jgi:hypothetical protein